MSNQQTVHVCVLMCLVLQALMDSSLCGKNLKNDLQSFSRIIQGRKLNRLSASMFVFE